MFIKKIRQLKNIFYNNIKHGSILKYFNKNIDTSISGPPKITLVRHKPKVNLVYFVSPYDYINTMDNANNETHIVDVHEEHSIEYDEEEKISYDVNENIMYEE